MKSLEDKIKVGMISLGCPKNLVDAEVMLGLLKKESHVLTNDASQADVLIVNTCAFIEESKKESIDTILEVAQLKAKGSLKKLIVTGCLAQRYQTELEQELPEVDHFIGTGEFQRIAEFANLRPELPVVRSAVARPEYVYDYATPRLSTLPQHTAYVKIAEGCSRTCSFCIIPKLRGRGRSRSVESIVTEVRNLVENGALEINLIAQDLTAYGLDLKDGTNLEKLLLELVKIDKLQWIRLMYNYPQYFTHSLIELIASSPKICKYLDMPLQHIDSELLSTMRRKVDEEEVRRLIDELKKQIPDLVLRTTLIVGFPGETEKQFEKLVDFVKEVKFHRLGVFTYSQEEGTLAAKLPNQIPLRTKKERRDHIMGIAQQISSEHNYYLIGKKLEVLVDAPLPQVNGYSHIGRYQGQALEIDGIVYLSGRDIVAGSFVKAKISKAKEYDLKGHVL